MITTVELAARTSDPEHTIVDVRPLAAYNGWRLAGEPRGGHVPGARSLPLEWTRFMDWIEVLDRKGIVPDRPVTVYGYSPAWATPVSRCTPASWTSGRRTRTARSGASTGFTTWCIPPGFGR
jgi:hypothetical protein